MSYTPTAGNFCEKKKMVEKTFSQRKLSQRNFHRENFHGLFAGATKDTTPLNVVEKTLVNSHKTLKFAKVFSLKSFPLYSNIRIEM